MASALYAAGSQASDPGTPDAAAARRAARHQGEAPRYQLRAFGPRLQRVRSRMRRRGREADVETLRRLHLVGPRRGVGLVIRDGRLEVRRLVGRSHALEHWAMETAEPLPLDPDWARRHLPELLGIAELAPIGGSPLPLREIALQVVLPDPQLEIAFVQERRTRLHLGDVRGEFADARVAGIAVETAAVEGTSAEAVRRAALLVGMDPSRNTSWPEALRALLLETRASASTPSVSIGRAYH